MGALRGKLIVVWTEVQIFGGKKLVIQEESRENWIKLRGILWEIKKSDNRGLKTKIGVWENTRGELGRPRMFGQIKEFGAD